MPLIDQLKEYLNKRKLLDSEGKLIRNLTSEEQRDYHAIAYRDKMMSEEGKKALDRIKQKALAMMEKPQNILDTR